MISRRTLLKGFLALTAGGVSLGGYSFAEPFRLKMTNYKFTPKNWPRDLKLKMVVLADIHACEPWMGIEKIRRIVARVNAMSPDVVLLLGDFVASNGIQRYGRKIEYGVWADALSKLQASLGVHAVMGNHDWWDDPSLVAARAGIPRASKELSARGVNVLENDCVRLVHEGQPVWLAGLGSQTAFWLTRRERKANGGWGYIGTDDLAGTLDKITDDAPVILMAHEPDIFPKVPDRVSVTLSGHTHGGQIRLFGRSPVVPSKYGNRYAYGHVKENGRNLIVSGGLGCSILPVRFGVPPEIVSVEMG